MKEYEYESIATKEHAFRLILLHPASKPRVQIEIIHASLDDENLMPYEAVSYVWGAPERCIDVEVLDLTKPKGTFELKRTLKVTNSLELTLKDLQLPDAKRCLWIDGICINQNDQNDEQMKEKNHQVRLMDKIYNCAERVLFHLGRPSEAMPILRDTINDLQKHPDLRRIPETINQHGLEQELEKKLEELEELQEMPETAEVQEQVYQKIQELQEIQEGICNLERRQEPPELQETHQQDNSSICDMSKSQWQQVLSKLYINPLDREACLRHAMEEVLNQPWFRRVWIVQEVANSRAALIYWGPETLSVRWFVDLARRLDVPMDTHQRSILNMMPRSRRDKLDSSSRQDLYDVLVRFSQAQASRGHDKIFALLGMCKNADKPVTITIDYSRSLNCLLRDTIANIADCDESQVPAKMTKMDQFTTGISTLLDDLVVDFAVASKMTSLKSLLLHRGDQIIITPQMIERMVDGSVGPQAFRIVINHRPDTIVMPVETLEHASSHGDPRVAELLLTRCPHPTTAKWTRAETSTNDVSDSVAKKVTQLGRAILADELDDVRQLLEEGADVQARGLDNLTPLSLAAVAGKQDSIDILLDYGADIEARDSDDQTALALAVLYGKEKAARILLDNGADIETKDKNGRTPLSLAASGGFVHILSLGSSKHGAEIVNGQKEERYKSNEQSNKSISIKTKAVQIDNEVYSALFQLLLDRGPEINSADNFNQTALWWAVNYEHEYAVEKLLVNGANPDIIFNGHMSLLSWSIWNGYTSITTQLLENSAVGLFPPEDSLEWTIRSGDELLLDELIDRGATINTSLFLVAVKEENTAALKVLLEHHAFPGSSLLRSRALLQAVSRGDKRLVKALLEAGCDVNCEDSEANTPLSLAVEQKDLKMVKLLLARKGDPDGSYRQQRAPLTRAAQLGCTSIAKHLIEGQANVNARCVDRYMETPDSPLMWACRNGHIAIVELLLGAKADIHLRDINGETALDWARRWGKNHRERIMQMLEDESMGSQ